MKEASLQVLLPVIPVILQTTKHQKKNTRSMEAYRSGVKQTMSEAIVITSRSPMIRSASLMEDTSGVVTTSALSAPAMAF